MAERASSPNMTLDSEVASNAVVDPDGASAADMPPEPVRTPNFALDFRHGNSQEVELSHVRISLHPARPVYDDIVERFCTSFRDRGYTPLLGSVSVCRDPTGEAQWLLIDGGHRLAAMKVLLEEMHSNALSGMSARVYSRSDGTTMTEVDALQLGIYLNRARRQRPNNHELAVNIIELSIRHGGPSDMSSVYAAWRRNGTSSAGRRAYATRDSSSGRWVLVDGSHRLAALQGLDPNGDERH